MARHIPMLFKAEMIRAMLDGRKTETRRLFWKRQDLPPPHTVTATEGDFILRWHSGMRHDFKPPVAPGDLIWAKETWRPLDGYGAWDLLIQYNEDGSKRHIEDGDCDIGDWSRPKAAATGNVSPLFMPKWASRLTLRVTGYRIERLHDITPRGAVDEGIQRLHEPNGFRDYMSDDPDARLAMIPSYASLWGAINGPGSWDENPWVSVTQYEVEQRNILDVAA